VPPDQNSKRGFRPACPPERKQHIDLLDIGMRPRPTTPASRGCPADTPPLRDRLRRIDAASVRTTQARLLFALALLSVVGWINLPASGDMATMAALCGERGLDFSAARAGALIELQWAFAGHSIAAGGWMLLAMAPPLLGGPLGSLWTSTARRRRPTAVAAFMLGYAGIWTLALPPLCMLMFGVAIAADLLHVAAPLLGLGIALAWQLGRVKRTALALCHLPAAARGDTGPGVRTCFTHGITQAAGCVGACWAAMVLPMLVAGDPRPLSVLVAGLLFVERVVSSTVMHGAR
jgi:hypothetical protein